MHHTDWNHNKTRLFETHENAPIAKLSAIYQGQHAKSPQVTKLLGYDKIKDARTILTSNIHVMFGPFTGQSQGWIQDFWEGGLDV